MNRYDYHSAQAPIPREHVPSMAEWRKRHKPFDHKEPGLLARLFGRG